MSIIADSFPISNCEPVICPQEYLPKVDCPQFVEVPGVLTKTVIEQDVSANELKGDSEYADIPYIYYAPLLGKLKCS